jgi:hypothetical protein
MCVLASTSARTSCSVLSCEIVFAACTANFSRKTTLWSFSKQSAHEMMNIICDRVRRKSRAFSNAAKHVFTGITLESSSNLLKKEKGMEWNEPMSPGN